MSETKTPEDAGSEWLAGLLSSLAALIRRERGRAFDAGAEAQSAFEYASMIDRVSADEAFAAARAAAIGERA